MTADLGPLPDRRIVDRHAPTGIATYGWTTQQLEAERQRCYALGAGRERERCAKAAREAIHSVPESQRLSANILIHATDLAIGWPVAHY